jgi:two-component system cell cycle sensor histidine kinase/response regulator CckA
MTSAPTFDAVFTAMQAAAGGDLAARVALPPEPDLEHEPTKLAITLNLLLDDMSYRAEQRARFEERLRQFQKMEAIGNLAGSIAHDFNNLLSVILGYTDLALKALPPSDPVTADLVEVLAAADRAKKLTSQLLAFSRKQVLEAKPLDLNGILHGMEGMLRRLLGETIDLCFATTEPLGSVKGDRGQLEQVILNLCVNARDGMPNGGRLTLETANAELDATFGPEVIPGGYVLLGVTDTGVGMTPAVRERIFEPFFTTKEHGRGTGLGLATVFGIVRQSGGHIAVTSEPGAGTSFKTYFPRIRETADDGTPAGPGRAPEGGRETVLLVEDTDSVRVLVRAILARNGYHVLEAQSAEMALGLAEPYPGKIHLLVTDVVLPRMTGPVLAERLGALRPELKVLFMSGYTDGAMAHHGLLEPGLEFVEKPVAPNVLLAKVRAILGRSAPLQP